MFQQFGVNSKPRQPSSEHQRDPPQPPQYQFSKNELVSKNEYLFLMCCVMQRLAPPK
jgi:hypothetical protein